MVLYLRNRFGGRMPAILPPNHTTDGRDAYSTQGILVVVEF